MQNMTAIPIFVNCTDEVTNLRAKIGLQCPDAQQRIVLHLQ